MLTLLFPTAGETTWFTDVDSDPMEDEEEDEEEEDGDEEAGGADKTTTGDEG